MSVRRRLPVLLVCCCLTAYFGFHAIHGKHGLEARWGLQARAQKLAAELRGLEAVRAGLEREVALLSNSRPDPAFVEELARSLLGYARPGDRILLPSVRRQAQLR
jgi:cell division protein FtsB